MLIVGWVGWGKPHPTSLTPDEQYTLWTEAGIHRQAGSMRWLSRSFTKKNTLGYRSNMSRNAFGSVMLAPKSL